MPAPLESRRNQRLRDRYRPAPVRILFVGESPPASGRFFYRQDSGLYRAVRDAFRVLDPSVDDNNFLVRFQEAGCYLVDLCEHPVDKYGPSARRAACVGGEDRLTRTIRQLHPLAIVTVLKSIRANVHRAAAAASWSGAITEAPYPGRWKHHRDQFIDMLLPVLSDLSPTSAGAQPASRGSGCAASPSAAFRR